MEGLVALGLVCNVFQIISFAHELYDVSKRVVKDGSPDTVSKAQFEMRSNQPGILMIFLILKLI